MRDLIIILRYYVLTGTLRYIGNFCFGKLIFPSVFHDKSCYCAFCAEFLAWLFLKKMPRYCHSPVVGGGGGVQNL